jgi:anti-sigma factor RsiW
MSCSLDLKAYVLGELSQREKSAAEDHVRACASCHDEVERLNLTRAALATLEEEEPPRRIAFVSDRVFEPRWWQTMWHSGPAMGFASASVLAAAILVHGFARPAAAPVLVTDTAQVQRQIDTAVTKAVTESEARQSAEFAKVLQTTEARFEDQRRSDLATVQQAADYYRKQMAQFLVASNVVASNEGPVR